MSQRENVFINTEKRVFYIHDNIDKESISKVCYYLLFLLNEDQEKEDKEKDFKREPVKIYINSGGGQVEDMWSLIDIMTNSKTPIYTYSTGYAHSAAFMIFIAGSKRFITKHTKMCCHQFSSSVWGRYQEIAESIEYFNKEWKNFKEYVCKQTKITKEKLQEVRERKLDWYIYSEESVELGVATDIINEF